MQLKRIIAWSSSLAHFDVRNFFSVLATPIVRRRESKQNYKLIKAKAVPSDIIVPLPTTVPKSFDVKAIPNNFLDSHPHPPLWNISK